MFLALLANFTVERVSTMLSSAGLIMAIIVVLQFPPRLSLGDVVVVVVVIVAVVFVVVSDVVGKSIQTIARAHAHKAKHTRARKSGARDRHWTAIGENSGGWLYLPRGLQKGRRGIVRVITRCHIIHGA